MVSLLAMVTMGTMSKALWTGQATVTMGSVLEALARSGQATVTMGAAFDRRQATMNQAKLCAASVVTGAVCNGPCLSVKLLK